MALDFPPSPAFNEIYTFSGRSWQWNGYAWDITPFFSPMSITLTTGSMYTYDGADSLFFTKDATNRIYELDLDTMEIQASTSIPYAHSTAIIGSRMEVVSTADGLKYLYVMRHTGQEMWRTLKFW